MKNKEREFRFVYPARKWEQDEFPLYTLLPGQQVKKKKLEGGLYIPDGVEGHIEMREKRRVRTEEKKGTEIVVKYIEQWSAWMRMCTREDTPEHTIIKPQAVPGRGTCPRCLKVYKAMDDLPENRLLKVWEQGGTKVFDV